MADPYLGLLQGLNAGVQSYMDRSSRLDEIGAQERKYAEGLLREEQKEKDRRQFELDKLEKEFEYKKQLEKLKGSSEGTGVGGKGKVLPAGEATALGSAASAVDAIQKYRNTLTQYPQATGAGLLKTVSRGLETAKGLVGAQPSQLGQDLQALDAERNAVAQSVGTFLEGGKLTDSDFQRYRKMLPEPSDTPEVAKRKEQALVNLITSRQSAQRESLGAAGYNVGNRQQPSVAPTASSGPKVGQIESGYEFLGGNPADKKNWRPVR